MNCMSLREIIFNCWRTFTTLFLAVAMLHGSVEAALFNISPAVTSGDIDEFEISPDGQWVAFVGTLEGIDTDQAYIVPITGGTATLLNPTGVGDVDGGLAFTPDSSGVVVRYGGGAGNSDNQMYLLPTDGSQIATQLTFNNFNVFDPQVSADGSTLFYSDARDSTPNDPEGTNGDDLLFATSIPNAGAMPAPTLITPDDVAEIDTGGYAQVGTDIVFAGSLPGEGETRFYRTAADGSGTPSEILVSNFPTEFTGDIDEMAVTPDGQTIVFVADATTDGVDELYSMPIAGGEATRLLPSIEDFTDIGPFVISPDGSNIAFQADFQANGVGEAYVVSIDGGVPIQVSEELSGLDFNADVTAGVDRIQFTPDGMSVFYIADGRMNGFNELFVVANPLAIPEPSSFLVLLSGVACCILSRRGRN